MDQRIEQALREIGQERRLSQTRRNRIRAAMMAAAQEEARRREQRARGPASFLWLRAAPAGLALASMLLIALAAYILAGGAGGRPLARAESDGPFTLLQRRAAPPGIVWHASQDIQPNTPVAVAEGDILYAPQPVTITFEDQSIAIVQPDTEIALPGTGRGLRLQFGQVDLDVRPAAQAGAPLQFTVETRRASILVKGTRFSVSSDEHGDTVTTTQGIVEAAQRARAGAIFSAEIRAGEEAHLRDDPTAPPVVQLHAPLARAIEPDGRAIPPGVGTRQPAVILIGSAYPGGALTVEHPGLLLTTPVDLQGRFTVPVTLPDLEGACPFTLTVRSPDGRSRAGQFTVIVDRTAPDLAIDMPRLSADGARVQIQGQTEPGAAITANGIALPVSADGRFAGEIALPADRAIRVIARDFAGNESALAQTIRP